MASVTLEKVRKVYPGKVVAVEGADLEIFDREFMVLVGPSGCGKTTTLRMIAGLEEITEGTCSIGEQVVNDIPAKDRDIAMVFQNYALYPHMTVYKNMSFGLKLRKTPKAEIERRVSNTAETLGLTDYLKRRPKALSGGQRQRVALGRAIVRDPSVFLLDEPLSNLDAKMRVGMRQELKRLHQRLQTTMVLVTHDQVEAMTLGDRICVMNDGQIQQVGAPLEVYDRPANRFVASFIGTPAMNLIDGEIVDGRFRAAGFDVALQQANGPATLGIRPEKLRLAPKGSADSGGISGTVDVVEHLGESQIVLLKLEGDSELQARLPSTIPLAIGTTIQLTFEPSDCHVFDGATGIRCS